MQGPTRISRVRIGRAATLVALLPVVLAAYWWTATSSINPYTWRGDFYNLLADAFRHGQVSLREQPSPQLLQLSNPYDPQQNERFRLHDAALYKGRYYVYHGPTPALTLFLPWQVITGTPMQQSAALVIYTVAGFIFSALLWWEVCASAGIPMPAGLGAIALWALAFCQPALFLLRRPAFYEIAIASGACFLLCAFWLLLVALRRASAFAFLFAGVCFGLAAGARPHMIIGAAIGVALVATYVVRAKAKPAHAVAFAIPIILSCGALAAYNYIRFGSPFEFGVSYLLSGSADTRGVHLAPANVRPGLYYLLFHMPAFTTEFPFVYLTAKPRIPVVLPPKYFAEGIAGCIAACPAVALGFVAPLLIRRLTVVALTTSAVALIGFVAMTGWATERYEGDFSTLLVVLALSAAAFVLSRLRSRATRIISMSVLVTTVAYGTVVYAGISIAGPENTMRRGNPSGFARLRLMFRHEPGLIVDPAFSIDAVFTFDDEPPGSREPILCTGKESFAYVTFAEFTGPARLHFASMIPGVGGATGPEVAITPGNPYTLQMVYDRRTHTLTMTHDSALVFAHEFVMMPTTAGDITVGQNRIADWIAPPSFHRSARVLARHDQ